MSQNIQLAKVNYVPIKTNASVAIEDSEAQNGSKIVEPCSKRLPTGKSH